jgi:hypothetical protein
MLAQLLAFLGSLFNLFIDTIYKIGLSMLVMFLCVIAVATAFTFGIFWLVT